MVTRVDHSGAAVALLPLLHHHGGSAESGSYSLQLYFLNPYQNVLLVQDEYQCTPWLRRWQIYLYICVGSSLLSYSSFLNIILTFKLPPSSPPLSSHPHFTCLTPYYFSLSHHTTKHNKARPGNAATYILDDRAPTVLVALHRRGEDGEDGRVHHRPPHQRQRSPIPQG